MPAQYVFSLTILIFGLLMVFLARFNWRNQKTFLARNQETADKLALQRSQNQELLARQAAALERIAAALERGKP